MKTVAHVSPWSGKCRAIRQWQRGRKRRRRRWRKKNRPMNELMLTVGWVFASVNFWWAWLMWGSVASSQCCWCVWKLSLSADGQFGNVNGTAPTHQTSHCVTPAQRGPLAPATSQLVKYLHQAGRDRPLLLTTAPGGRCCRVVPGLSCVVAPADRILLIYPLKPQRGVKIQSRNSRHGWSHSSDSACPTESAFGWARGFRDVTNIINRAMAYSLSISQSWAPLAAPRHPV